MDAKTLKALKASIAKWKRNAKATDPWKYKIGAKDCALCGLFLDDDCSGCPVRAKTGKPFCFDSPYVDASRALVWWQDCDGAPDQALGAAQAEVAFLKSLLPEEA
jgi:hypothetical protein